ncbi:hypothetical protein NS311_04525 [Pantoea ananatis]|uniref:hypothetical protein n=2 Tax=Pantoea ananas TaxID=553 RepID=UPI000737301C|nr:hypothetical protein [Pantoea ananatis]KTR57560.1 hypothetical protein NS311_04525 [Pantoea ananatis]KTR65899.1 hypothetical protein RSA47_07665 [Pantoea ananatis]KTR71401.1 hypothetical protein NS296_06225 [Pantoea ananatis]MDS7721176.1 hypothetical protein [Pantoea ananatis]PZD65780.1 hypothetical protein ARC272_06760 [Pantoea ananatis]
MKQPQSDVTAWRYVYRGFDTEKKWKATGEGRPIRQVSDAVFKKTDLHSDKEISGVKTHFYFFKIIKKSIALNAG